MLIIHESVFLAYSYPQAQPLPQFKPKDLYPSIPQPAVQETKGYTI